MTGFTVFEPIGMRTDYPIIDIENKQVTARIIYKNKVLMTVHIDLQSDVIQKEGNLDEVADLATSDGIKVVDEDREIRIIKSQAEFFIQNKISDFKEYLAQVKKKSN